MSDLKVRFSDRVLAVFLAALMVIGIMPLTAFASVSSVLTTDIGEKEFVVGTATEFTFTTKANDDKDIPVVGTSDFSDSDAIEKLEYYEVKDGNWYTLSGDFGPSSGFPMSDATSRFRVTFKKAGDYTFTASMKYAQGDNKGETLCTSGEIKIHVSDKTGAALTTDIGEKDFVVGEATEFTFTTKANDDKDIPVVGTSDFSDSDAIEKLEYYEVKDGNWYTLSGDFGPSSGFPMSDATSRFRVTFKKAGDYTFTASMKYAQGENKGEALCTSGEIKIHVKDKFNVSVSKEGDGAVTVNGIENGVSGIIEGTAAQLSVIPDENWQIASVTIGDEIQTITDASSFKKSFTVNSDTPISVTFVRVYTVVVQYESENGSVTVNGDESVGDVIVTQGENIAVKATPKENFRVAGVTVNESVSNFDDNGYNSENPYTKDFSADRDYAIVVTFAPFIYKIQTGSAEHGTVSADKETVDYGGETVVTVKPDKGYTVASAEVNRVSVYGNIKETDEDDVFEFSVGNIREDINIEVTFKECEPASLSDFTWNESDALRTGDGNIFVFKDGDKAVFKTDKQGIRITLSDGTAIGGKDVQSVEIAQSAEIEKIELRYDFGWHEVKDGEQPVCMKIVFDNVKPTAEITANTPANAYEYYNKDVLLTVSANDSGDYSGIASIEYWICRDGNESEPTTVYTYEDGTEVKAQLSIEDVKIIASENDSGNVVVYAQAKDRAGNVSEKVSLELKICTISPRVTITFDDKQSEDANNADNWYNDNRTATITVNDREDVFDETAATNGISFADGSADGYSLSEWENNGDVHTAEITFTDEGSYNWSFAYTNKAGLDATATKKGEHTDAFGIDKTAPFGTITVQSASWDSAGIDWSMLLEKLTFGLYSNKEVTVGLKAGIGSDLLSGFQKVTYYVSNSDDALTESELIELYENDEFVSDSITISNDEQFSVYARIVDNAGNTAFIGTNGVIYDKTAGEISIAVTDKPNDDSFYGVNNVKEYTAEDGKTIRGINADIEVTDIKTGEYYSGIKKVEYTVSCGETQTQSGTLFEFENINPEKKDLVKDWSGSVVIDADKNNGKNITLTVTVTDNAGNTSDNSVTIKEINLDDIEAIVMMSEKAVMSEDGFGWYDESRTAYITITDRASTFDAEAAKNAVKFTITDKDGNETEASSDDVTVGEWVSLGNTHSAFVTFNSDGKYSWDLDYTNKAGNKLSEENISYGESESPKTFTIDRAAPDGSVKVGENTWAHKILSVLTFGLYSNTGFDLSVDAYDDGNISPITVKYYKHSGSDALDSSKLDSLYNSGYFSENAPDLTGEQQFTVYVRITDNAGNYTYVSSDGHVIDETPQAEPIVAALDQPNENGIYGLNEVHSYGDIESGIRVSVSAKEADSEADVYAGLKEISYEVKSRNSDNEEYNVTQSGILYSFNYERNPEDSNGVKLTITDVNSGTDTYDITDNVPTKDMLCREWAGCIVVDADKNNACDVAVTVKVTDNAGNESSKMIKLDIDITAPAISVSYDNNYAQNAMYFNAPRTATVVFTERSHHFDEAAAEKIITDSITAVKSDGTKVEDAYSVSWASDLTAKQPDSNTFTATVSFEKDAHYTFGVSCTDKAGNTNVGVDVGDSVAPYEFVVDTEDPSGTVSVNGNTWSEFLETLTFGLYSNSSARVKVSADDEISPVKVEYYKSDGDFGVKKADIASLALISAGDYENSINKQLFTIDSTEQFNVYVKITDKAGHAVLINSDGYIVDTQESSVSVYAVTQANENGVYGIGDVKENNGVKLHIDANDTEDGAASYYSGIASVSYTVTAELNGKTVTTQEETLYEFKNSSPSKSELLTNWSGDIVVDAEKNNSSKVLVTVTVRDNAGNTESDSIELDIDVTTPTVDVTFDNNTALNKSYFNAPRTATVVITERSEHFSSAAATDGIVITAVDAEGNKVDGAYKISGWTEKTNGSNPDKTTHTATVSFSADANYTFAVSYTGKSGNSNAKVNTGSSVEPYKFTVDTTVPDATVSVNDHIWDKLLNVLTFGLYSRVNAEVKVDATDKTSPITVEYYKTNDPVVKSAGALDKLYADGKFVPYKSFTVNTNEQFVVYIRITDNAGNYKYISTDGYIADLVSAELSLTPDAPNGNNVYNKDVNIKIEASDAQPYSGIAKVEYWVLCDGEETQRKTLFSFDYTREDGENTNNGTLKITDWSSGKEVITELTGNVPSQEQLVSDWSGSFTVDSSLNNSSNVRAYVGVTDNAGNYKEQNVLLDIDVTEPAVKVSYDSEANGNAKDGYYTERTAIVEITERTNHFDAAAATNGITVTAVDANGAEVENAYIISAWTTTEGETPDEAKHTAVISYIADANYKFAVAYTDKADNKNISVNTDGQANPYEFTVDRTAPEGTVTAKSAEGRTETWSSVVDTLTFGFWSNSRISVSGTSDDATSPIASVDYYMPVSEIASDNTTVLKKAELDEINEWKSFKAFDVTANTQFTVYIRITDNAGNYTYISTNGLIVDDEHPVEESVAPEISVSPAKPVNGIYSSDVKVSIKVEDPMVGGTYSGLKEVSYAVFDRDSATPDKPTQEGTLFTFDMAYPKQSDLQQEWTGEITVSAAKNNSNNIQLVVYAKDNSLNAVDNSQKESRSYTVIKIDTTAPVIDIAYDNNNADSGTYFKASRTAVIKITERNFDAKDVKVTVTNTDGAAPAVIGWTNTAGTYNKDDAVHTATVTYASDGDYTFAIEYTDLAGNKCTKVNYAPGTAAPTAFTVDKTMPTVSVSYDNNSAANGKYFNAARTATVTVHEHNFSAERVSFSQTASLSGSSITVPGAVWTSHRGDVHTAVISYTADGDYTFDVSVRDSAGNTSGAANYGACVAANDFTVDTHIDEPAIGGVKNGEAYNGAVIPTVSFTDVNFDSYEIKLVRTRFGNKDVDVTAQFLKGLANSGSGISGAFDTFEKIADNDGIYTLTVKTTDLAGNSSSSSQTFTVNRFGSVYEYDDYLVSLIKDGGRYIGKQDGGDAAITGDLIVTEYNASRMAAGSLMILITRNGEAIDAKYTCNPNISENTAIDVSGWYKYVYIISKDNFTEDGVYRITISSKDNMDNVSTSVPENSIDTAGTNVKDTIVFTVDTTKPEIRNITMTPQVKFHDDYAEANAQTVTVNYTIVDVGGLKSVEVLVNGKSQGVISEFEDSVNSYEGSFTINESKERQKIQIKAVDLAGNVTDTSSADFNPGDAYEFRNGILVTTNMFVRWYENKALFWGSIGGVVGAAVIIWLIVFLAKRRRKNKDK